MTFMQKLFSFEGRMRRQDFWICSLLLLGFNIVVSVVLNILFGGAMMASLAANPNPEDPAAGLAVLAAMGPMMAIYCLLALVELWPAFAITVKRGHDRDQTGWLTLICLVPFLGWLFALINYGILDGTPGPNRYGPSPKGLGGEEALTV